MEDYTILIFCNLSRQDANQFTCLPQIKVEFKGFSETCTLLYTQIYTKTFGDVLLPLPLHVPNCV